MSKPKTSKSWGWNGTHKRVKRRGHPDHAIVLEGARAKNTIRHPEFDKNESFNKGMDRLKGK